MQHEDEINFVAICKELKIDYVQQFLPALDLVLSFRNVIIEHIETLRFSIISSINKRVRGKGDANFSIADAKFILELIESQSILPKLRNPIASEKDKEKEFKIEGELKRRLKLGSTVNSSALLSRLQQEEVYALKQTELKDPVVGEFIPWKSEPPKPPTPISEPDEEPEEEESFAPKEIKTEELLERIDPQEPNDAGWDLPDSF